MCTDVPCYWDKPRKESVPVSFSDLQLGKKDTKPCQIHPLPCTQFPLSNEDISLKLATICKGKAAVSPYLPNGGLYVPPTQQPHKCIQEFAEEYKHHAAQQGSFIDFLHHNITKKDCENIELLTMGQSENPDWINQRKGRITSSIAHAVTHFRGSDNIDNYITRNIMYRPTFHSVYTEYGIKNEPIAKVLFKEYFTTQPQKCFRQRLWFSD